MAHDGIDFGDNTDSRWEALEEGQATMDRYNAGRAPVRDRVAYMERAAGGTIALIGGVTYLVGSAAYRNVMKQRKKAAINTHLAEREDRRAARAAAKMARLDKIRAVSRAQARYDGTVVPLSFMETDDDFRGKMDAGFGQSQIKNVGSMPTVVKKLTKEELSRAIWSATPSGVGVRSKSKLLGGKRRVKRRADGMIVPYMESLMMPFYAFEGPGSSNMEQWLTVAGVEAYSIVGTDDLLALNFEGNRQAQLVALNFTTGEIMLAMANCIAIRRTAGSSTLNPGFGSDTLDDAPATAALIATQVSTDQFRLTTRFEALYWANTFHYTNLTLSLANISVTVYRAVGYHSKTWNSCQVEELAEWNARLALQTPLLTDNGYAEKAKPTLAMTDLGNAHLYTSITRKYWRKEKTYNMTMGALQTCSVVVNGPVGIQALKKFSRNADDSTDGVFQSVTATTDTAFSPISAYVVARFWGGELGGDASAAQNMGTCSGRIGVRMDQSMKVRVLPNNNAKPVPFNLNQRPFILEANNRTLSYNNITWKNPDDVDS